MNDCCKKNLKIKKKFLKIICIKTVCSCNAPILIILNPMSNRGRQFPESTDCFKCSYTLCKAAL